MWFDKGLIKGYRLPNGRTLESGDRRIYRDSVEAFMRSQGMDKLIPAEWVRYIIFTGLSKIRIEQLEEVSTQNPSIAMMIADPCSAIALLDRLRPIGVVVESSVPSDLIEGIQSAKHLLGINFHSSVVASADDQRTAEELRNKYKVDSVVPFEHFPSRLQELVDGAVTFADAHRR